MPKLILWEELWKAEGLLAKLLRDEQPLRRFKQNSGNAFLLIFNIVQLQNFSVKVSCVAMNNFDLMTGKSILFGIKRKENWSFLKKYAAVT